MKILLSPDYGAGWTTWNRELPGMLTYGPLIEAIMAHGNPSAEFDAALAQYEALLTSRGERAYLGGASGLIVVDIPAGTKYRITEFDGSEAVEYYADDTIEWQVAT